jgi:autotransporter-associated beta strand protein
VLAAGAAVTLANVALGQTYTWIGPTGNFTATGSWLGGTTPVSSATTVLNFTSGNAGAVVATNNMTSPPFVVNAINFSVNNSFQLNGAPTSNTFQLVGPAASITMGGVGTAKTVAGAGIQLVTDLNLNIAGPGTLDLSGALTESGSHALTISGTNPRRDWSVVNLGGANPFSGGLTLDGGVVTTTNGNVTTFGANGTTLTVTANGGTIGTGSIFSTTLGAIQLNGDLRFILNGGLTLAGSGGTPTALQGPGTMYIQTLGATITLNGNSGATATTPFTGAVVIGMSELPQMTLSNAGSLSLAGVSAQSAFPNGSLNNAASFDVQSGGQLVLNNSTINSVQNGDRIADTAPVTLHSASLGLLGAAAAGANGYQPDNLNERIGTLTGAGHCTVTMTPTASTNKTTTLDASSWARLDRGTFNLRGTALGDGVTATRGRIVVDATGPGTFTDNLVGGNGTSALNVNILPYAVGGVTTSDLGTSLVTWGAADGFRPLNTASEYDTALPPGDPTNNVRLTSTMTNNAIDPVTLNALVLGPAAASPDASVSGTGTLNITSGVIVSTGTHMSSLNQQTIANNVAFGNAEAVIYTVGQGGLKISGQLTGSNGLTKTSNGTAGGTNNNNVLTLTADNSGLTGPLTINGGYVLFGSDLNLPGRNTGPTLDPIVVNGSNVSSTGAATGFFYAGASNGLTGLASITTTLNRPIAVDSGMFTILVRDVTTSTATNIGSLALAGPIAGNGGVNYQPQAVATGVTNPGDIYVTGTTNTYGGTSRFAGGNTHIYGEGSLSTGPWEFGGGTLVLEGGDQTNSRQVNVSSGGSAIDTNGHNLTLNGPITAWAAGTLTPVASPNGALTKKGSGTLTLNSPINLLTGGAVTVSAGTLIVNGNLGASSADALTVASGATLGGSGTIYRNTTVNGTLAPGNSPGILTISGTLTLGAGAAFNVDINGPVAGTGYDQVVQVSQTSSLIPTTILGAGTATLNVSLGYGPSASDMFWLINNTNTLGTATTTTGNFVGLNEGDTVPLGSFGGRTYTAHISYNGNFATGQADHSGNDVVLYGIDGSLPPCCRSDFNGDGSVGTDADIESFFACLSGDCCPTCPPNADFNCDGGVGTDADIESFFRVLSGGPC